MSSKGQKLPALSFLGATLGFIPVVVDILMYLSPHDLSDQKILITGASGFIGSYLCQKLSHLGAKVHAISRSRTVEQWIESPVQWHQADVTDLEQMRQILVTVQPDVVFHLAGYVSGARGVEAVLPTLHSHVVGTVNLLTLLTEIGCQRVVLSGSLEEPSSTTSPIPSSPYAAAKWASHAYGRMFYHLYQLPIVEARLFLVYGPAQKELYKLIPYVTLSLLNGKSPELSSGQRLVDWLYVEDAADGLIAAAFTPGIEGRVFEFGSATLTSIAAVVQQITQQINPAIQPRFGALPERAMEQVRKAEIAETQAVLGWVPKTSLERGLAQTVQWYADHFEQLRQNQAVV